jgi:hypothetical protein
MSITHIDENAWDASYTPGYTLEDGELVWGLCRALYQKYRQIETCPSDFSDHPEIADYDTAINYIKRKIAWMDKLRLPTISLAYSKGKDYNIFKHVKVQLPTHTRNNAVECIIEKIVKDKNAAIVKIDCVMIGSLESAWYNSSITGDDVFNSQDLSDDAVLSI